MFKISICVCPLVSFILKLYKRAYMQSRGSVISNIFYYQPEDSGEKTTPGKILESMKACFLKDIVTANCIVVKMLLPKPLTLVTWQNWTPCRFATCPQPSPAVFLIERERAENSRPFPPSSNILTLLASTSLTPIWKTKTIYCKSWPFSVKLVCSINEGSYILRLL